MDNIVSFLSFIALVLVVILLTWSLILAHREKSRKLSAKGRLSSLRQKIESLPNETDEDKSRKEALYRELHLEYLDNILGGIEQLKSSIKEKSKQGKKEKPEKKKKKKG